jgi:putative membrane protein
MEMEMDRILLLSALSLTALTACNQDQGRQSADGTRDTTAGAVGQASVPAAGSSLQSAYVSGAVIGDMYEVQAADMALERATNSRVKTLARMIKTDHAAASDALKAMLPQAAPDTPVPTSLDARRQELIENLRSASATSFDTTFLDQQIAAHREALTLHRGFSDQDSAVAAHARSVVPKIEAHLRMAEEIKGDM